MKTKAPNKKKRPKAGQRRSLALARGWAPVARLPKINSAKITHENRVYLHPVAALGGNRFECEKGWALVGWNRAPIKGSGPDAICYEKTSTVDHETYDAHGSFEPGLYWGHGNAEEMLFGGTLADIEAEELNPWLGK